MSLPWSTENQACRRTALYENHRQLLREILSSDGRFIPGVLYTQNGFVFEAAATATHGEFSAFRKRVLQAELTDRIAAGIRTTNYRRSGLELKIAHDPFNEGEIPPAWINGQPRETPRFRTSTVAQLP
jgi:hypothetical protein